MHTFSADAVNAKDHYEWWQSDIGVQRWMWMSKTGGKNASSKRCKHVYGTMNHSKI
jgi:hypothetical protein